MKLTTEEMIKRLRNPLLFRKCDYELIAARLEALTDFVADTDAAHDAAYGILPPDPRWTRA